MAVSARLWFHFCAAIEWFPAALNLFLPTAIGRNAPEANFKIESFDNKARLDFSAVNATLQFGPPDASQSRSDGQLMVPLMVLVTHGRLFLPVVNAELFEKAVLRLSPRGHPRYNPAGKSVH